MLGYCHVKQPIYFRGDLRGRPLGNDALEDDYAIDVIGETSADALLPELVRRPPRQASEVNKTAHGTQQKADFYVSRLCDQLLNQWQKADFYVSRVCNQLLQKADVYVSKVGDSLFGPDQRLLPGERGFDNRKGLSCREHGPRTMMGLSDSG